MAKVHRKNRACSFLGRIAAVLVAILLGALTALAADPAAAEVGNAGTVSTDNDQHRSSVLTHATSERGPPTYDRNEIMTSDAVDRWSRGAPARPNGPKTAPTCTYDNLAPGRDAVVSDN